MHIKNKALYTSFIFILTAMQVNAAMLDNIAPVDPTEVKTVQSNIEDILTPKKVTLTQNDIHNHYTIAMQRFIQCNVKSAYMDFKILIQTIVPNDYAYLKMADEMAEIGFFNLSQSSLNKVSDKDIAYIQSEDIKNFYFPKKMLKDEDEVYLAEVYSNIMYNAQGAEATAELIKNTQLLEKSDYANYLAALGLLKSGNTKDADNYINKALKDNPNNLNYQKLKIEIALQGNNPNTALRLLNNIKTTKLYTEEYINKINALEQYTLYKTCKNDVLKKYHLGYYYYWQGEYTKAARTLQGAVTSKKSLNREVYALLSEVYFAQKEYEKAENFADKSLKLGGNNKIALMVMGKVKYHNKEYKEALKYFKEAQIKSNAEPSALLALTYEKLGNLAKAKEINTRILKEHSDCKLAYYNVARLEQDREYEYMKKAVSLNLSFVDGWVGLVKNSLDKNNYENARKYLAIVKYIDENDFRYYYYQGLLYKAKGLSQDANYFFKKSLSVNPENELAKKELGI